MPSEAQLQSDLQAAMKARDAQRLSVLRDVVTAVKNLKVEKMVQAVSEADITGLMRKEISKRAEATEFAQKANRQDLIDKNNAEKAILEGYLPAQLDAERLEAIVREISAELGSTQIGPVMAKLRERHAGQYDGKLASEIIKKLAG